MARPPLVLLVTHSGDHTVPERVAQALAERGAGCRRFDTDRVPAEARIALAIDAGGVRGVLEDARGALDLAEVSAVWLRKAYGPKLPDDLDPGFRDACRRETAAGLAAFLDALEGARWVNALEASRAAENKARQMRAARAAGLRVPRTLLGNDPAALAAFFDELEGRVVAKMLTPLSTSMGKAPRFVRTTALSARDLEHSDLLRYSPMAFQERIEKEVELRVACVGDEVFAAAIDASASRAGRVDWRGARPDEARWTPADLPEDVARALVALTRSLGLVYGAADLIRTPAGEHVFLEINPSGEWGMLELEASLPISAALARALVP